MLESPLNFILTLLFFFPLNNQLYKIVYVRVPRITLCCCYSSVRGSESEVSQCVLSLHTPESRVISANGRKLNTKASSSSTNLHQHRVALIIGSVLLSKFYYNLVKTIKSLSFWPQHHLPNFPIQALDLSTS